MVGLPDGRQAVNKAYLSRIFTALQYLSLHLTMPAASPLVYVYQTGLG